MAIDLGDIYNLTFPTNKDAAGNPVSSGTLPVCTVTLPDLTTATPTVTVVSAGVYLIAYPTTVSGRHTVRLVGTGANAFAQTDTFHVLGADPGLIISLAEARAGLRIPAGQTVDDEDLRSLIASTTVVLEDLCGAIVSRACDEWHDGGYLTVRLLQAPVISIATVTESYGAGYTRTLTEQALSGTTFDAFGYTADKDDGSLTRRMSGVAGPFMNGRRNIHVTYTAGRSVVGANLIRAARRLNRFMWQQEINGQRQGGSQPENMTTTPSGYLVPNAIKALCGSDLRTVGQG